jgi:hypothetical protein
MDSNLDQILEIYVYNSDSDKVRVISLMPTYSWGGRGMLGAEVGTGYLHRLPNSCRSTVGSSVERKVRLTKTTAMPSRPSPADPTDIAGGEASEQTVLELEPHLEMEVEKDANNLPQTPEDITKQPHQLGTHQGTQKERNPEKTIATQTQTSEHTTTQTESMHNNSRDIPATIYPAEASSPQRTSGESGDSPIRLTSASSEDAEALFAGPPPDSSAPALLQESSGAVGDTNPKYFMPAPPKMTY